MIGNRPTAGLILPRRPEPEKDLHLPKELREELKQMDRRFARSKMILEFLAFLLVYAGMVYYLYLVSC